MNKGQTLIEVVVISGVVVLVLVALVAGIVASISNNRIAKERTVSTRLAQQPLEWLRGWRDTLSWQAFLDTFQLIPGSTVTYCVNVLPEDAIDISGILGECAGQNMVNACGSLLDAGPTPDPEATPNPEATPTPEASPITCDLSDSTPYVRTLDLSYDGTKVEAVVHVTWDAGNRPQDMSLSTDFYQWSQE